MDYNCQNIRLRFGNHVVFSDLSFSLGSSERCLLLGANGSGKSSLLRLLAGLIAPSGGTVNVSGGTRIGYFGHSSLLYSRLTVKENIEFFATLLGTDADAALESWQLRPIAQKVVKTLSRGQMIKTSLCRAFLGSPDLLLLDEPTASLDDDAVDLFQQRLRESTAALLMTTHDVVRIAPLGSRAVVLNQRVISFDSPDIASAISHYQVSNR